MIKYIINMLPYMIIGGILYLAVRICIVLYAKQKINIKQEIARFIFTVYCVGIASQTIIPKIEFGNTNLRIIGSIHKINLIPFKVFVETYNAVFVDNYFNYFLINFLGNIIVFIPFGILLPIVFKKIKTFKATVLTGFCISLFIEICQFPLYRGTDVDDLWLNSIGVMIGFVILKAVKNIKFSRE